MSKDQQHGHGNWTQGRLPDRKRTMPTNPPLRFYDPLTFSQIQGQESIPCDYFLPHQFPYSLYLPPPPMTPPLPTDTETCGCCGGESTLICLSRCDPLESFSPSTLLSPRPCQSSMSENCDFYNGQRVPDMVTNSWNASQLFSNIEQAPNEHWSSSQSNSSSLSVQVEECSALQRFQERKDCQIQMTDSFNCRNSYNEESDEENFNFSQLNGTRDESESETEQNYDPPLPLALAKADHFVQKYQQRCNRPFRNIKKSHPIYSEKLQPTLVVKPKRALHSIPIEYENCLISSFRASQNYPEKLTPNIDPVILKSRVGAGPVHCEVEAEEEENDTEPEYPPERFNYFKPNCPQNSDENSQLIESQLKSNESEGVSLTEYPTISEENIQENKIQTQQKLPRSQSDPCVNKYGLGQENNCKRSASLSLHSLENKDGRRYGHCSSQGGDNDGHVDVDNVELDFKTKELSEVMGHHHQELIVMPVSNPMPRICDSNEILKKIIIKKCGDSGRHKVIVYKESKRHSVQTMTSNEMLTSNKLITCPISPNSLPKHSIRPIFIGPSHGHPMGSSSSGKSCRVKTCCATKCSGDLICRNKPKSSKYRAATSCCQQQAPCQSRQSGQWTSYPCCRQQQLFNFCNTRNLGVKKCQVIKQKRGRCGEICLFKCTPSSDKTGCQPCPCPSLCSTVITCGRKVPSYPCIPLTCPPSQCPIHGPNLSPPPPISEPIRVPSPPQIETPPTISSPPLTPLTFKPPKPSLPKVVTPEPIPRLSIPFMPIQLTEIPPFQPLEPYVEVPRVAFSEPYFKKPVFEPPAVPKVLLEPPKVVLEPIKFEPLRPEPITIEPLKINPPPLVDPPPKVSFPNLPNFSDPDVPTKRISNPPPPPPSSPPHIYIPPPLSPPHLVWKPPSLVIPPFSPPAISRPPSLIIPPFSPPEISKPPSLIIPPFNPEVVKPPSIIIPPFNKPEIVRPPSIVIPPFNPPEIKPPPEVKPPPIIETPISSPPILSPPSSPPSILRRPPSVSTQIPTPPQIIWRPPSLQISVPSPPPPDPIPIEPLNIPDPVPEPVPSMPWITQIPTPPKIILRPPPSVTIQVPDSPVPIIPFMNRPPEPILPEFGPPSPTVPVKPQRVRTPPSEPSTVNIPSPPSEHSDSSDSLPPRPPRRPPSKCCYRAPKKSRGRKCGTKIVCCTPKVKEVLPPPCRPPLPDCCRPRICRRRKKCQKPSEYCIDPEMTAQIFPNSYNIVQNNQLYQTTAESLSRQYGNCSGAGPPQNSQLFQQMLQQGYPNQGGNSPGQFNQLPIFSGYPPPLNNSKGQMALYDPSQLYQGCRGLSSSISQYQYPYYLCQSPEGTSSPPGYQLVYVTPSGKFKCGPQDSGANRCCKRRVTGRKC